MARIAHADPAADYPTALTCAGATIEVVGPGGTRTLSADAFFEDYFTTALDDGEIIVAVHVPSTPPDHTSAYRKIARADGDFAIASIAFRGAFDGDICTLARVVVGGCAATPVHSDAVDRMLGSTTGNGDEIAAAAAALADACDPIDDVRGSADYRRVLVRRLLPAVVADARRRAER